MLKCENLPGQGAFGRPRLQNARETAKGAWFHGETTKLKALVGALPGLCGGSPSVIPVRMLVGVVRGSSYMRVPHCL